MNIVVLDHFGARLRKMLLLSPSTTDVSPGSRTRKKGDKNKNEAYLLAFPTACDLAAFPPANQEFLVGVVDDAGVRAKGALFESFEPSLVDFGLLLESGGVGT